jgi:FO synthase
VRYSTPGRLEILELVRSTPLSELTASAARLRDQAKGNVVTYSRKAFIPLTRLCRDVCHYCTYATTPRHVEDVYLPPDQVLTIARAAQAAGCQEALFTLGDKPEYRYRAARDALSDLGCTSAVEYLKQMAELVLRETDLLPHLNPGILTLDDYRSLRAVAPSMGLMLESSSSRLCQPGGPHHGSPDKEPETRLKSIADAGRAQVPFTSGILIGIGETREERIDSLLALRALHERYGHIQELIIQNFVPKQGTIMADAQAPDPEDLLWAVAVSRHLFGPEMSIQVPPNLNQSLLPELIAAGVNDWGGVSPVTPDHVNPESPWPTIQALEQITETAGKRLVQRLTIYPEYVQNPDRWIDSELRARVLRNSDSEGLARCDEWSPGTVRSLPFSIRTAPSNRSPEGRLAQIVRRARAGERLAEHEIVALFSARGVDFDFVCHEADDLRRETCGDAVTFVINRNINYTNICLYKCQFCAFSKGKVADNLRGRPYSLELDEIRLRTEEAWARGATEVCLQGGIHPAFTGDTYLGICRAVKEAVPDIHVHAFSPLEIHHGAETLGVSVAAFLKQLRRAGLGSLPGTAAEILDDKVRRVICPDKLSTAEWLSVVRTAHELGISTTSTIMFGHIETPLAWARHLLLLRDLQQSTGGLTEFVPLPFVHMEAPMYIRGRARKGPTYREALLMHAVARLVLNPMLTNIQASWVKMGPAGASGCLAAGANDIGGTLMNESISRAAGASHGQELTPEKIRDLAVGLRRVARQRTTLYQVPDQKRPNRCSAHGAITRGVHDFMREPRPEGQSLDS